MVSPRNHARAIHFAEIESFDDDGMMGRFGIRSITRAVQKTVSKAADVGLKAGAVVGGAAGRTIHTAASVGQQAIQAAKPVAKVLAAPIVAPTAIVARALAPSGFISKQTEKVVHIAPKTARIALGAGALATGAAFALAPAAGAGAAAAGAGSGATIGAGAAAVAPTAVAAAAPAAAPGFFTVLGTGAAQQVVAREVARMTGPAGGAGSETAPVSTPDDTAPLTGPSTTDWLKIGIPAAIAAFVMLT